MKKTVSGSTTYLSEDVAEQVDGSGDLTLFEYFSYIHDWPGATYGVTWTKKLLFVSTQICDITGFRNEK